MNQLNNCFTEGSIVEKRDSLSLFYILMDPQLFFLTGYKVLQSQEKKGFVRCNRILHNGRDKLVYDISKYKSLESMLPGLRPEIMAAILGNLFDVIIEVKNNGFMQCRNIEITVDKIFIDCNNYKVYLIYLPVDTREENIREDYIFFENQLKGNIIKAIHSFSNLSNPMIMKLCDSMRDSTISIEALKRFVGGQGMAETPVPIQNTGIQNDFYGNSYQDNNLMGDMPGTNDSDQLSMPSYISRSMSSTKQNFQEPQPRSQRESRHQVPSAPFMPSNPPNKKPGFFGRVFKTNKKTVQSYYENMGSDEDVTEIMDATEIMDVAPQSVSAVRPLLLEGMGTPERCEISVTKPVFVIGKNNGRTDYAITFNRAVSGEHCKLINMENQWYLADLGSTNGTFLNGVRLVPDKPALVKSADRIRIANIDFTVK